jgi:hypothetical protein
MMDVWTQIKGLEKVLFIGIDYNKSSNALMQSKVMAVCFLLYIVK